MKVKAVKRFKDANKGVTRKKGDTFIVSKERFQEINSTKFGELVKEIKK